MQAISVITNFQFKNHLVTLDAHLTFHLTLFLQHRNKHDHSFSYINQLILQQQTYDLACQVYQDQSHLSNQVLFH